MKTIILYCNRNTGLAALCYLKARGYDLLIITEDKDVEWMAGRFGLPVLPNIDYLRKTKYDLFICVHGRKIIPKECLVENKMVNIHPTKYNGHNPVKKYIENKDTDGCIRVIRMVEDVDAGELLHQENFKTPVCNNYADFYNVALIYYYKVLEKTLELTGV